MPTPWDAAIRNQQIKDLSVFAGPDLKAAPAWGIALFKRILEEFNRLSSLHKLGVTVSESLLKPDTPLGANVQIEVSSGAHSFILNGQTQTGSLPSGLDIVGKTHVAVQGGEIQKAFIFVPIRPTIVGRGVGTGVKLALALHEVLHAVGLNESDPGHFTGLNDPDLFMSGSQLEGNFPPDGNPGDRLNLGFGRFAPPLFITARTASLVQSIWK